MSTVLFAAGTQRSATIVSGEYSFTNEDFRAIAAMLHADAGIELPDTKATLAYSRLAKRLRFLGLRTFREYCILVASPEGAAERGHMLSALTTNVTRFFREPHHFEHLKSHVLPPLLEQARRGGRVRLWSAACSTGQEPYSLALTLLALAPDAATLDVRILATDIDPAVLAQARRGHYGEANLAPVPRDLRHRWFTPAGSGAWSVADELRQLVVFRTLNLNGGTWPMRGRFQVVLCRNVVIYFDDATQAALWGRLAPLIEPAGHLYIGHSERLTGSAARAFEGVGTTMYRRHDGAEP